MYRIHNKLTVGPRKAGIVMSIRDDHNQDIASLISEWDAADRRGETVDIERLSGNSPELANQLQAHIDQVLIARWMQKTPDYPTENLAQTNQPKTMGAIGFGQTPEHQAIRADGFQIGDKIADRYRLIHILGEGATAIVWLANDLILERLVAVKIFRASFLEDQIPSALAHEARLMARFEHPSILPIYDQCEFEGRLFLILKYVPQRKSRNLVLPPKQAVKVVVQITESVKFLHDNGVVHCDIKPGNILVDPSDRAFLSDYGIALDRTRFPEAAHAAGTTGFLAPERLNGGEISAQSDIYSLGIVLFSYLTGHLPTSPDPRSISRDLKQIPATLKHIVLKAISQNPDDRYSTIKEFADALKRFMVQNPDRLKRIAIASGCALILLVSAMIWSVRDYFKTAPDYPTQSVALSRSGYSKVIHGDWDADGDQDVATFLPSTGAIEFFLNNGKGELSFFETIHRDNIMTDTNSGYFNDDDRIDLIHSFSHKPIVAHSSFNKGKFTVEGINVNVNLISPVDPKTIDFNRDKHPDIVVLDRETNDIALRLGLSEGQFQQEVTLTASENESSQTVGLYLGDVNQDKYPDFIVGIQSSPEFRSGITVFLQTKPGQFNQGQFFPLTSHSEIGSGCLMDVDFDGDPDLIIPDKIGDRVIQFVNDGKGGFAENRTLISFPKPALLVQLDNSENNRLEIAVASQTKGLSILGLKPNNQWSKIQEYPWSISAKGLAATDLDNDGTLDLIANLNDLNKVNFIYRRRNSSK